MINTLWVAEFAVQLIGATLSWKASKTLCTLFTWLCLSDVALFLFYGHPAYWIASWLQQAVKFLLLAWLGCELCGMFVHGHKKETRLMAAFISFASAAFVMVFFCQGETLKDRLLDGEIAANMILWSLVSIGWIARIKILNRHWQWIAAGFVMLIGWDLGMTILWKFWDGARHWYPAGTIAAYAIWAIGPNLSLREFRLELGKKFEVTEEIKTLVV